MVKRIRNISIILFSVFYMLVSIGIIIENSYCYCNGGSIISVAQLPDSVYSSIQCNSCCNSNTEQSTCSEDGCAESCACNKPIINFIKLTKHFGENSIPANLSNNEIFDIFLVSSDKIDMSSEIEDFISLIHYFPPDNLYSGRILLNFIKQLKFDDIA